MVVHGAVGVDAKVTGRRHRVDVRAEEQEFPAVAALLPLDYLLDAVAAVVAAGVLHAVRGDDEQRVLRGIHLAGVLVDVADVVDGLADGVRQRRAAAGDILPFGQRLDPPDVDAVVDDPAKFQMYGWQQHIERCIRRRSMETASSPRPFPPRPFVRFQPKSSGARTPRLSAAKLGDIGRYGAAIRRALARGFASHAWDKAPGECACCAQANVL